MSTTYGVATVVSRSYLVEQTQNNLQKGADSAGQQLTQELVKKVAQEVATVKGGAETGKAGVETGDKKDRNIKNKKNDRNRLGKNNQSAKGNRMQDITV